MRAAGDRPLLSATLATILALGCFSVGIRVHARLHGLAWRSSMVVLGAALAVIALSTMWAAGSSSDAYPVGTDWVGVAGAALAAGGVAVLVHIRAPGRSFDVFVEGLVIAVTCAYVPWAWAVSRGADDAHAAVTLMPVTAWCVVVWMTIRLTRLADTHPTGFRYLGGAFLTLLMVHGVLAGAELGNATVVRHRLAGAVLWACCLWGVAALHPSLRQPFASAEPRRAHFGMLQLTMIVAAILLPSFTLLLLGTHTQLDAEVFVGAATVVPVLVAVYLVRQIQDRSRAEYRAQHDPLTGLPNRVLFDDRLETTLARARRAEGHAAVMFLDLDRFKAINDSLGHAVGNQLLQSVAKRLRATIRETDTVARMGGDEFTVLVSDVGDVEEAVAAARRLLAAFNEPHVIAGRRLHIGTSIGVAVFPEDGDDGEALLKHADSAMYRAKARGRGTYELYTPDLSARAQLRLAVETALRHALEAKQFELHYQPRVDVRTGSIVGLEALARWEHPELGTIPPEVFIPVAEETGLITAFGEWTLDEAVAQTRHWIDAGFVPRPVSVNLSIQQFSEPTLAATLAAVLERHNVAPSLLEIEITESLFMRDLTRASTTLEALRQMGVKCSIDDFGTGFSGLRYLAGMSIDCLKIDQSFIAPIQHVDDDAPIIEAIIALGRSLGLNVVAEGVETEHQARFLLVHGCSQMQGYLFTPALPALEMARVLAIDDDTGIAWLEQDGDTKERLEAVPVPALRTAGVELLCAIRRSDEVVDVDDDDLEGVLLALAPPEPTVVVSSAFRTASMRLAAGTFIGCIPLSVGLASAGVLPGSTQAVAASVLDRVGVDVEGGSMGGRPFDESQWAHVEPVAVPAPEADEPPPEPEPGPAGHAHEPGPAPEAPAPAPTAPPPTAAPPPSPAPSPGPTTTTTEPQSWDGGWNGGGWGGGDGGWGGGDGGWGGGDGGWGGGGWGGGGWGGRNWGR
jgi:diguanylate cyclase (GGDEF)-like protein